MRDGGYHIRQALFAHREWMDEAACKEPGVDPDWFFPEISSDKRAAVGHGALLPTERIAKAVCLRCPVRDECLRFVIEEEETGRSSTHGTGEGVWGGTLPRERRGAYSRVEDPEARFAMLTLMVTMQGDPWSKDNPLGKGLMDKKVRVE